MASQHGSRFVSPVYNQNFSPNGLNVNPGMNRPPRPQFQRPPNPPNGSFQSPEGFVHGFQNRPQFSNFPGACGFLNRPPPAPPSSTVHPPPHPVCNPFSSSSNSHPPFPCALNSHPPFPGPSNPPPFPGSSNPPTFHGSSNPPPFHGSSNTPHFPGSTNPSHFPGSSNPSHFPGSSNPPSLFPGASNSQAFPGTSNSPFSSASNSPFPPQPQSASHPSFSTRPSMPPPLSHQSVVLSHKPPSLSHHSSVLSHKPPTLSHPPFSPQRPFSPQQPPQHNQLPNVPHHTQQNQFPPISQPPNQHPRFHLNSPPPASRPRFDNSFQRPYRSWNQTTRFSGPRTPFSNRSPNVVKSNQFKDNSQQVSNKKREKSREFRKLKDDSTEKPYSCDTCDRAFVTKNELNDHISQHIKCDYETCTFKAHPKIVLLHKKMQHETGYAERISKLKDDAEVRKWREERRKRFPTAENIKKRQAEQAERAARGEVLETKEFGKFKRRREEDRDLAHNDSYSHRRRTRGRRGGHRGKRNHFRRNFHEPGFQQFKVNSESDSDSDSHISLNMFSGLSSLSNSAEEEMCHSNEIVESSSSEQNLSKSISNIDENHLNLSHSENNSIDRQFESPVLSNAEKSRGIKRTADESILELPEDKIDMPKRPLITVEDSDDEGPEVMGISKCLEEVDEMEKEENGCDNNPVANVSKMNHEEANRGKKRKADESILEIPEDKIDTSKRPLTVIEDSDDEGPKVMAINKCLEEVDEMEKEETVYDNNAVANVSKMNREEANREEKKIESVVNDESKVSEMSHEDASKGNQSRRHRTRRENNFSAKQYAANKIRKNSLLEKLLADDIRHERNVILQCIRHIVNNNFFGLAVKKS